MKSLVQSLFDEDDEQAALQVASKIVNTTKPAGLSIARLLETSGSEAEEDSEAESSNRSRNSTLCNKRGNSSKLTTSVYIEETDSE
jgi:hypothetical protein